MRILVVEDDPRISRKLETVLDQAGYAVDPASDGEEAWLRETPRTTTWQSST